MDACSDKNIVNWIILNGGWAKFLHSKRQKPNYKLIIMAATVTAVLGSLAFIFRHKFYAQAPSVSIISTKSSSTKTS